MEQLYFPERGLWREWLEKNHAAEKEAFFIFYKKHTGKPTLTLDEAVEEALCFGWIDSVSRTLDSERYVLRFSPRKPSSKWADSNIGRVKRLIADGLMTPAGMRTIPEGLLDGSPEHARSPLMKDPPPEFLTALDSDPAAKSFYESLPKSQKEMTCGWINSAKRPETREKRIREAVASFHDGKRLGAK